MSTLGAEIAAQRLMAPFFGSSTVIWANTIAVVLLALSVGYWLGGRLADRRPEPRALNGLVLLGQRAAGDRAVHRASVPVVERERVRRPVGGRVHGLAVRDARAGGGAAAAARRGLAVGDAAEAGVGRGVGRRRRAAVRALDGRLAGGRVLRVAVGDRGDRDAAHVPRARRGAGAGLAACGLGGRFVARAGWCCSPRSRCRWARPSPPSDGRVLYETETPYQYARVVEEADGTRKLELNEGQAIHSLWRPGTVLTGGYWDGFLVLPFATGLRAPAGADRGARAPRAGRSRGRTRTTSRTRASTPSTSTRSCSRSGAATSGWRRGRSCASSPRTRGRSCARPTSATTRSSSTPTASPTSRSI